MRDYQRRTGKYILPTPIYHQVIWIIRDFYRMSEEAEAILHESPGPSDGMPRGQGGTSDPNAAKAIKREELLRKVDIVDKSLKTIPPEYRQGVWQNILYHSPFPMDAARSAYGKYKSRFVWEVAHRLNLI